MARARLIKPGFFANEYLAELPAETRLLFAGLWTIADRAGRLEDRPLRIKAALFPYDSYDIASMLEALEHCAGKFITRYTVGERRYIQILNFSKHQNPHIKEPASVIPPPDTDTICVPAQHDANTIHELYKNNTSTMQEPCKNDAGTEPAPFEPGGNQFTVTGNPIPEAVAVAVADARAREGDGCGGCDDPFDIPVAERVRRSDDIDAALRALAPLGVDPRRDSDIAEGLVGAYPLAWVIEAASRTRDAPQDRQSVGYLKGILEKWQAKGCMDSRGRASASSARASPEQTERDYDFYGDGRLI